MGHDHGGSPSKAPGVKQWVPLNADGLSWLYGETSLVYRDGSSGKWMVSRDGLVLWGDPYLKGAAVVAEQLERSMV